MTRTLHIRIESTADFGDLGETLESLDRGEDVSPADPVCSIEDIDTLGRILRPINLRLLETIVEREPESIRALARAVDRPDSQWVASQHASPPDVLDNVQELAEYGLVELEASGAAKRPVVWYDELDIDVPLHGDADGSEAVNAD
ncbi:hypothetical protein BRC71_09625 [Halobacteriales archaeon QH_7_65_31]|nr:MAG: hypothetical protein BRC71_09625 [Halobacteriales archaeon QH_7_65_31]